MSSSTVSKTLKLAIQCTSGIPQPSNFRIDTETKPLSSDDLTEGQVLVQLLCLSADPYMRSGMKTNAENSSIGGFVSGKVLSSKNNDWKANDLFGAWLPFTTIQIVDLKISPLQWPPFGMWNLTEILTEQTINLGVGVLGMPGSTAYGGLIDVLKPLNGETIFISAASGAVGSLVGLLAKKLYNCKVIGSVGGPDKVDLLMGLGYFDHAIDYKKHNTLEALSAALKDVAPDGIDMYFENVGGIHFTAALAALRVKGRIAVCGCISTYNEAIPIPNNLNIGQLIYSQQRIQGFVCKEYLIGEKLNFLKDMAKYYKEGVLKVPEDTVFHGIENWPVAFETLFTGKKVGKVVVMLNKED